MMTKLEETHMLAKEAIKSANEAMAIIRKLQAENDRLQEMHKINAHRLTVALNTIDEFERTAWQR